MINTGYFKAILRLQNKIMINTRYFKAILHLQNKTMNNTRYFKAIFKTAVKEGESARGVCVGEGGGGDFKIL